MSTSNAIIERLDSLEARLARRESQLRRHRLALVGLEAAAPLAMLLAADYTRFQHIQMSKLEIVDDQGDVVLALSANDAGGQVDLWNADNKNILRLSSNEHGGDMAVWNTKGKSVAGAWATADGGALATWNGDGARTARIDSADGRGSLTLHAGTNEPLVEMAATPYGGTMFANHDDGSSWFSVTPMTSGMEITLGTESNNEIDSGISIHSDGQYAAVSLLDGSGANALDLRTDSEGSSSTSRSGTNQVKLHAGGDTRLSMTSSSGGVHLHTDTDSQTGPAIELVNGQGNTVVRSGLRSNGGGTVNVNGPTGETVGMLRSDLDGNGRMDLGDAAGNLLITMQARKEQGPTFAMLSSWGKTLAVLAGTEEGGVLNLMNRNGVAVISTGIARDRRGGTMAIQNERGVTVISAGSDATGSGQVRLQDVEGKSRQVLPSTR